MKLERYAKIAEVPHWPAEPRDNVFLTRGWTASAEGALTSQQTYLLCRDEAGEVRGTGSAYLIGPDGPAFFNPYAVATRYLRDEALLGQLSQDERAEAAEVATRIEAARSTSAVNMAPFGFTHGFSASGGGGALRPLVRELDAQREEWNADCSAVLYVEEHDTELRAALSEEGYTCVRVGANCVLPIAWDSFDDYVATIVAHRRRKVRRERRLFAEAGFTVALEPIKDNLDEMAHLQALLQQKYIGSYDPDSERAVFESLLDHIGEYVNMLVCREKGEFRAFTVFLEKDGIIDVKMAARQAEAPAGGESSFTHFNMGYYEIIEEAMRRGVREIHYGPEGYRTKLGRGCVARPMYWYLKGPEPLRDDLAAAGRLVSLMYARLLEGLAPARTPRP